jgi:hypothetical protein
VKSRPTLFWNVTPCSPVEVRRLFEGTYCLRLQGVCFLLLVAWRKMERSSETSVNFTGLQVATSQKIVVLFIVTAVRTSNPAGFIVSLEYPERPPDLARCVQWSVPFCPRPRRTVSVIPDPYLVACSASGGLLRLRLVFLCPEMALCALQHLVPANRKSNRCPQEKE